MGTENQLGSSAIADHVLCHQAIAQACHLYFSIVRMYLFKSLFTHLPMNAVKYKYSWGHETFSICRSDVDLVN